MISSTFFMTMVDALELTHGSHVDLIAVVASVSPVSQRSSIDPFFTREICLMDSRFEGLKGSREKVN